MYAQAGNEAHLFFGQRPPYQAVARSKALVVFFFKNTVLLNITQSLKQRLFSFDGVARCLKSGFLGVLPRFRSSVGEMVLWLSVDALHDFTWDELS